MLFVLLVATLVLLIVGIALPRVIDLPSLFWTHIVVAGGIMTLITAAMQHFVPVLTRSRGAGKWMARVPFLMLLAGGMIVAIFGMTADYRLAGIAAVPSLVGGFAMLAWMLTKGHATLGRPHPGLDWYIAAMGCLVAGLTAAALIPIWPQWHSPLRAFHMHMNLYGFIGLTAVGTLQVLLPTAAGRIDPGAGQRLREDMKWGLAGAVCLALGKAAFSFLILPGLAMWLWPLARMFHAWWHLYRRELFALHGVEPLLLASTIGLALSAVGATLGSLSPLAIFLPGFLMPLLSGAAGQLAPVWSRPGVATPWHAASRRLLSRFGGIRALLFASAALLPILGYKCSGIPGLLGLVWFLILFVFWLWRD